MCPRTNPNPNLSLANPNPVQKPGEMLKKKRFVLKVVTDGARYGRVS